MSQPFADLVDRTMTPESQTRALELADQLRMTASIGRDDVVLVFGSNKKGVHGAGSALAAARYYGAEKGRGTGRTGMAYAIATKETWRGPVLSLTEIARSVRLFIAYARSHPELTFEVVRIGCGKAGYHDVRIAPLFVGAPDNVNLPYGWRESWGPK